MQNLKAVIEQRLERPLQQDSLRTDFQRPYERIVAGYHRENDMATIEKTFEDLLQFVSDMNEEDSRTVRKVLTGNHRPCSTF